MRKNQNKLRRKFIEESGMKYECSRCGIDRWFQEKIKGNYWGPITLQLDHKDGNHNNNDFSNLQLLCPNCHAVKESRSKPYLVFKNNKLNKPNIHNIPEMIEILVKNQKDKNEEE